MFDSARSEGCESTADTLARLDGLAAEAGRLAAAARTSVGWTAAERSRALASLDRLAGALATARAGLLAAQLRAGTSLRPGDRDLVAARAREGRTGLGEARREIRQAETLDALPAVADAVAEGRLPVAHVDALARATEGASEAVVGVLAAPASQAGLVQLAERLSVREFAGAVARLVATHEPAALERSVDAQRAARFLTLSTQPDGVFLRGRLDRLSGAALRLALDGVGMSPDETRDKPQADADALVALAQRATSGMAGVRPRRAGAEGGSAADAAQRAEQDTADAQVSGMAARPVVSVLVPAETFVEAVAPRGREAGPPAGPVPPGGRVPPAVLEDGSPVAMSQLAALLCDCDLGRVVLDAASVPLDLGRTTRLFTAAQRRAVIIRDRACAWNGCDVPAAYSEVHHIRWWDRDQGATDLDNAVLLCSHHHHVVHRHDLDVGRLGAPPGRRAPAPRHAPPHGGGGLRWEPMRYRFSGPGGRVVNAPPARAATVRADVDGDGLLVLV